MNISFPELILKHLLTGGDATACVINDQCTTYQEFCSRVGAIQSRIQRTGSDVIGIITQNHADTYATIVATWLTGKSYVPVNPTYPAERIRIILDEAGINHLFQAETSPESDAMAAQLADCNWIQTSELSEGEPFNAYPQAEKTAYILFTSGTTGKPKGVPISFGNLQAFFDGFDDLGYELSAEDRFLQMFELTFDLSVMSFAVPLIKGASFHTLPSGMIKTLGLYHVLESYEITFSLMVPSAINMLAPYLDDVELPKLRYSQFCGEALKSDLVGKWAKCIPNARIDNVYGPTEATIYCTTKTINPGNPDADSLNGVVGIGQAMTHVGTALFHDGQLLHKPGATGELCLAGKQLTAGYLNNPAQNEKGFFEHLGVRYYRTGDLAVSADNGDIFYLGRTDDQVKIQGFRIELAEIELAGSRLLPAHTNVAVGFQDNGENWFLALFVQGLTADAAIIRSEMAGLLPEYMVPHLILSVTEFPLNSNGKTDKKVLREMARKHML